MGRLDGKVAIITGAARGQGEAEARLFAAEGARVLLTDVLDDVGEKVANDIGDTAAYRHLDVRDPAEWSAAVSDAAKRFGGVDVLVNNAGILKLGLIEHQPLDEYLDVVMVNQVGCFLGMQAVVPVMKARGGGSIVNISSTAGLAGTAGLAAYTASKFAIRGMTKTAALELGHAGIRVNSVHPGGIDTDMVKIPELAHLDSDATYRRMPIPRIGEAIEVARLVLFLASDESSFSTGAEFVIDGGYLAGPPVEGM